MTMMPRPFLTTTATLLLATCGACDAFVTPSAKRRHHSLATSAARGDASKPPRSSPSSSSSTTRLRVGASNGAQPDAPSTIEEDAALQWSLFTKHHALDGEWWGTWSTYNYMTDMEDSTIAAVSLLPNAEGNEVVHTHKILTGSTKSDCDTCFSSDEVSTLPTIATYTPETLGRRHRCAASGMVVGPSLLKSGAMSTELVLRHGDGRVRVTFQHAPVWERGVEPGSCPPQGLKLFRAMVSKERLREPTGEGIEGSNLRGPPSAEEEREDPPTPGNPVFFRPIPPFKWHAKWAGTSWTWGPQTGDRGWQIEEVDEADSWHGRPAGDAPGTWSMRLPGGVLLQCPKLVVGGQAGICRLAWLPEDDGEPGSASDGNRAKLLRVEASVSALEPIISDDDEDMMVGFYPPSLGSLRTDVLEKVGELEGQTLEERERAAEGYVWDDGGLGDDVAPKAMAASDASKSEDEGVEGSSQNKAVTKSAPIDEAMKKKIADDPRNALDF